MKIYTPTPEQIQCEAKKIRAKWSDTDVITRLGYNVSDTIPVWVPPTVQTPVELDVQSNWFDLTCGGM